MSSLQRDYPWVKSPLIVSAPMLRIASAPLAVSVSQAGGLGFLAAGYDVSDLETHLSQASDILSSSVDANNPGLPIGIGFLVWGASLPDSLPLITKYKPAAVWLFGAPTHKDDTTYAAWSTAVRDATKGNTKIWVQVGTVAEALHVARTVRPDVLVLQGTDAGGHGAARSASIVTLVPEVHDALSSSSSSYAKAKDNVSPPTLIAAGGIVDARGVAAACVLGASGSVLGTRLLASREASIAQGYQAAVLRTQDGGISTVRSTVYDRVRGILSWPAEYDGRGVVNRSWEDAAAGMDDETNRRLYEEEMKNGDDGWAEGGRMTTYAGTGVGLVREVKGAGDIVGEVVTGARKILQG